MINTEERRELSNESIQRRALRLKGVRRDQAVCGRLHGIVISFHIQGHILPTNAHDTAFHSQRDIYMMLFCTVTVH